MRAIMVMFDSLSKRVLPQYGDTTIDAPNFARLAETCAVFDTFYAGSMPCMPARRELHTGRYNFLHRSWGPLEPFDNSMPEILKKSGVYTHLVSDHLHYWGDGGATYHNRYSSWENVRGQVADRWVGDVSDPVIPEHQPTMREFTHPNWWKDYWKNRNRIFEESSFPLDRTFDGGMAFLKKNKDKDNWFLQIEAFDPHEPFDVEEEYVKLYEEAYGGPFFNSPPYGTVTESADAVRHVQALYRALTTQCDRSLGRVLDFMDAHDMWADTMLIVNTDHGLLVGERDWWAKSVMPCYNELVNLPFAIWDPRHKAVGRRTSLAQTIDLAPTLLEFFGVAIPEEMEGSPLAPIVESDTPVRDTALFGYTGGFVNVTDGKRTYMRASQTLGNEPCFEYTLMTTDRAGLMKTRELQRAELVPPFSFTKGCPVLKLPFPSKVGAPIFCNSFQFANLLWDLETDPGQENPVEDPNLEAEMVNVLVGVLKASDAPPELYERIGLDPNRTYHPEDVAAMETARQERVEAILPARSWESDALTLYAALAGLMTDDQMNAMKSDVELVLERQDQSTVRFDDVVAYVAREFSSNAHAADYLVRKLMRTR